MSHMSDNADRRAIPERSGPLQPECADQRVEVRPRQVEPLRDLGDVPAVRLERLAQQACLEATGRLLEREPGRLLVRLVEGAREDVMRARSRRAPSPVARISAASIACASWRTLPGQSASSMAWIASLDSSSFAAARGGRRRRRRRTSRARGCRRGARRATACAAAAPAAGRTGLRGSGARRRRRSRSTLVAAMMRTSA